ncbi:hypothetical protein [Candidatus Halobonum tyrrellensis]|uniref:DUF7981 domain-containing protein n=1 Tax=Candidatus Halobonum tyrrellensis G22 TaxID=1324957 RepID=V4HID1_9EURY|nr:hypothetical protein [Candidatus Halobonum tyrrellensis]ESP87679.1 hypothetical protein K933_12700 [Candidatus Halobonum tyrrellensis G22]
MSGRRRRSALLWGAVGALAFLVLAQGATLLGVPLPVDVPGRLGLAVVVGGVAAVAAYAAERRLVG